jgi:hypothetical protein
VSPLAAAIVQSYRDSGLRVSKATKAKEFLVEYGRERRRFALLNLYSVLTPRHGWGDKPFEVRHEQ